MTENITVSVILPVYNGEEFVEDTIKSILDQTFEELELIVINDGSEDQSEEVIEQFLPHDKIEYLWQENQGVTETFNRGIKLARGKYLAINPQDDISLPGRFEKQVDVLERNPDIGFVYSPAQFVNSQGEEVNRWGGWRGEGRVPKDELFYKLYIEGMFIASPSVLFRRDHITDEKNPWGDPEIEILSDREHWMTAAQEYDAYEMAEPVVRMLRDEDHDHLASRTEQVLQEEKRIIKRVRDRYSDGTPPVSRVHFRKAMSNHYLRALEYHFEDERDYLEAAQTSIKSFYYNPLNERLYKYYATSVI